MKPPASPVTSDDEYRVALMPHVDLETTAGSLIAERTADDPLSALARAYLRQREEIVKLYKQLDQNDRSLAAWSCTFDQQRFTLAELQDEVFSYRQGIPRLPGGAVDRAAVAQERMRLAGARQLLSDKRNSDLTALIDADVMIPDVMRQHAIVDAMRLGELPKWYIDMKRVL